MSAISSKQLSYAAAVFAAIILFPAHMKSASAATINVTVAPNGGLVFSPSSVTVQPGDTVRWTWSGSFHSTTSGVPGAPTGIWDSGLLNQGATFSHTFNTTGTFPYYCTAHGGCCGMVGTVNVVSPTPSPTPMATPTPPAVADGCYPNFTTAEGCDALSLLTIGAGNTGLGWRALFLDTSGSFNTAVGGGALVLNNGSSNTAVGAAALLLNTSGSNNTGIGTDALVFNDTGASNTATGYFALMNNTSGGSNTATGSEALTANATGNNNTAIGNQALQISIGTNDNVVVGNMSGSGITTANNNIIIGHHSGVHSVFGQESDRCYIDNIHGAPVSAATAMTVMVDSDGRLGTVAMESPGESSPKASQPQTSRDASKQALLDRKVDSLHATITQQQQQIETLKVQLKENAAQIKKANAQLEVSQPTAEVVVNRNAAPR
jgi:plastocyanin